MKLKLSIILSFSLLTACAGMQGQGDTTHVTLIKLEPKELETKCSFILGHKEPGACALINLQAKTCTIFVPTSYDHLFPNYKGPAVEKEQFVLGHELKHCFEGNWHK